MKKLIVIILLSLTALINKANAQSPTIQETRAFLQNMVAFSHEKFNIYDDGMTYSKECDREGNKVETLILFKNVTRISYSYIKLTFKGNFTTNDCRESSKKVADLDYYIKELSENESKQVIKAFEHICKLNGAVIGNTNLFKD